jgi:photosystem II stability/assembly factor-like uncharacterized protein
MNTLSKVLAVFCVLLSAVAYASWQTAKTGEVSNYNDGVNVSVATSADGKIVYVGKRGELFKSTDGGETWVMLK